MSRAALICGVSGQDGAHLAALLLNKGYEVYGTSRDAESANFDGLSRLGIRERVTVLSVTTTDPQAVLQAIVQTEPDEIYNLSGQSSVGLSFAQPVETFNSLCISTLNLLEALRYCGKPIRLYNACSSECFGNTSLTGADEDTPFRPRSPYAAAKAAAFWQVANYREGYGVYAVSGLLFNHESFLRPPHFVTQKVVTAAKAIAAGARSKLRLGNMLIRRDWGWAPEYVEAMWLMLQQETPKDFVIATGSNHSLEEFVAEAFGYLNLDWRSHVEFDVSLARPTELAVSCGNPTRALEQLGWRARMGMHEVVHAMIDCRSP